MDPIKFNVPSVGTLYSDVDVEVKSSISTFSQYFADSQDASSGVTKEATKKARVENAADMTSTYYSLVTDFYEYGYGASFHFSPVYDDRSFAQNIQKHEQEVAKLVKAKPGMKVLDAGCGVGGPGLEIARYSGANVVGLNYCGYQVKKAREHAKKAGLNEQCTYVQGDFCAMEFEDNSFDGVFTLESTCHSKNPVDVYSEIFRVLKPGAFYVDSAWAMTDTYDPNNPTHEKVKQDVLFGNSLPDLYSKQHLLNCLRKAGFDVVSYRSCENEGDKPWYQYLVGDGCCSLQAFNCSRIGRGITHATLYALETIKMAPPGTTQVHSMLQTAASGLIESGKLDIFTPCFLIVARKPLN